MSGEDEGLSGSDYALRELISSKRIKLAAPVKDAASGKMKTVEYEVEGPISLLYTTTKPAIHHENATRCFLLSLDESADQTLEVLKAQRAARTVEGMARVQDAADLRRLHRNVQRLIKPVLVVNPYAEKLAFPHGALEMRREHEKYLSLIEAVALLGQHRREKKRAVVAGREAEYIEVEPGDVAQANALMAEVLGAKAEELSRPSRELLALIKSLVAERAKEQGVEARQVRFTRRELREYAGWSDNQVKAHVRRLEELEYLVICRSGEYRGYRYELGERNHGLKQDFALADAQRLEKLGSVGHGLVKEPPLVYAGKSITKGMNGWAVG